jgi:hypothetical protein
VANPGYYWSDSFRIITEWAGSRNPDGTPGGNLCNRPEVEGQEGGQAVTWPTSGLIMICPVTFDLMGGRQPLSSLILSQANIPSGLLLDSLYTPGAVFLHEMMHWINQGSKCISVCEILNCFLSC